MTPPMTAAATLSLMSTEAIRASRSAHDLRLTGHAGLFFRFEVMPGFGVVAADNRDRIGAFLKCDEGVNLGRLRHDRDIAGPQAAIVDDFKVGITFLGPIVFSLIDGVFETAFVDRERLPDAVV